MSTWDKNFQTKIKKLRKAQLIHLLSAVLNTQAIDEIIGSVIDCKDCKALLEELDII
jgi:hypothetical protein